MLAAAPEALSAGRGPGKVARRDRDRHDPDGDRRAALFASWLEDAHADARRHRRHASSLGGIWLLAAERLGARTRDLRTR